MNRGSHALLRLRIAVAFIHTVLDLSGLFRLLAVVAASLDSPGVPDAGQDGVPSCRDPSAGKTPLLSRDTPAPSSPSDTVSPRKRYVSTGRLAYWPYRMASLHIIFTMKQYERRSPEDRARLREWPAQILGKSHSHNDQNATRFIAKFTARSRLGVTISRCTSCHSMRSGSRPGFTRSRFLLTSASKRSSISSRCCSGSACGSAGRCAGYCDYLFEKRMQNRSILRTEVRNGQRNPHFT